MNSYEGGCTRGAKISCEARGSPSGFSCFHRKSDREKPLERLGAGCRRMEEGKASIFALAAKGMLCNNP